MAFSDTTMYPYQVVSASAGAKKWVSAVAAADYGNSQALWRKPGYPTLNALDAGSCRLVNRSGLPCTVGLGVRFAVAAWVGGQLTAAGVFTDDTADMQNATTDDALLYQRGLPDGNGILLGATEPFNTVALILSTAGNQTTPVLALSYWNAAAWVDLTGGILFGDALLVGPGEKVLLWGQPLDWAPGGSGTNVPQTMYNIRLLQTTGGQGTIDPLARQVFLGYTRLASDPVGNLGTVNLAAAGSTRFSKAGDAAFPFFSVASPANFVEMYWRTY